MKVSIIIVNYNTKVLTNNCIRSVQKFTENIDYEIILVDNASNDGSKAFFEKNASISYIYTSENLGFGRANNLGAESATGEYLFFLNSDTLLKENSVKKLYDFYERNAEVLKIGVLGCTLTDEDGSPNGSGNYFPTIRSIIIEKFGSLPLIRNFLKYKEFVIPLNKEEYYHIDYVLGADMFLRKDLFYKVNLFNPEYFMYYEEAEIQRKITELGYKNFILKNVNIVHLVAKSSSNQSAKESHFKRLIVNKSRIVYLRNNKKLHSFLIFEYLFILLNFLNFNYSFKENLDYCKVIIKKLQDNE